MAIGEYTVPGPWGPPGIDPGDIAGGYPEYGVPPAGPQAGDSDDMPVSYTPVRIGGAKPPPPPPRYTPPPSYAMPLEETIYPRANGIVPVGAVSPLPAPGPQWIAGAEDVQAVPMALPAVVAGAAILGRIIGPRSLLFLKAALVRFGPVIVKAAIGVLAFNELMDLIGWGAPDETMIQCGGKKKKRYSIGSNPRVGTLAKVSRHCKRMLKRHEKVIREFIPKPARLPAKALAATYLSTAEKRALQG